ncbi:MAG: radical SAM protein [Thermodesulfobacteriota bacterium]|nr:radical SAM protein [Thermodesulfobacteriota bacterium]
MKELFHVQWHITNLCNLRCKHCYQDDFSMQNDLDWSGLKKVSDNLLTTIKEWDKTACIHLTGGEPLLKSELFSLLNDLDQNPTVEELGIITNGLLIDQEVMERLSDNSKLRKIKVSLDGANAAINDGIRSKGTFDKVMRNLSLIIKEDQFETILMFTVMKRNFRSLSSLIKLCRGLGVHGLIIERFIPLGRGRKSMDEVLSKEEWKELVETLLGFFPNEGEEHSFLPYQAFQVNFNSKEPELLGAPCVIGVDGLCIMPNGDVFPCRRFPIPIGNLLETPLKQIWDESEILKKIRRKENLKGECGRCDIKDCRGCRSLALSLTGDSLAEDPCCPYDFHSLLSIGDRFEV